MFFVVAQWKFGVLIANISQRSSASGADMLVLRTSNFQGATIRPIVLGQNTVMSLLFTTNFTVVRLEKLNAKEKTLFIHTV